MDDLLATANGDVPLVATKPSRIDLLGTLSARLGFIRNSYLVAPGLYGVGAPDSSSPVLVTANYKLSFDHVRCALDGRNVWLLVLDTCGINVWCAAGRGTFSTQELVHRIRLSKLEQLVDHRRLIVPQLGASGISAHRVKEQCGFSVSYGPIRADDIAAYIDGGRRVEPAMREISFTLKERAVLIPVEFYLLSKSFWWLLPALYLLSGIGPDLYSLERLFARGGSMVLALFVGVCSGTILVPLLLPWLPGRSFALKGALAGTGCGTLLVFLIWFRLSTQEAAGLFLVILVISSYLGMNFTGSTPYTSPSGVEWEMKRALPLQIGALLLGLITWLAAPFMIV